MEPGGQSAIKEWITALVTFDPNFHICGGPYRVDGVKFGCLDIGHLPVDLAQVPIQIDDNAYEVMGLPMTSILEGKEVDSITLGSERAW
jgi:hypothetical protein